MMKKEGTFLSIKQASELLDLSEQRVRTLCRAATLPAKKFAGAWMLAEQDVLWYGVKSSNMLADNHPAYCVNNHKPIALSFFSGAMGMDLGIERAGFDIRLACEVDKFCRQTILLNRPNTALLGDINEYSASDIRKAARVESNQDIDLVVGGPPCQAFSTAGKRKGFNDLRGNVFLKYVDLAIELNPKYIVIENVRGLLSCPLEHRPHHLRGLNYPDLKNDEIKGGALSFIISRLKSAGYGVSFNLYNSANFGTPQVRERVIIVCSRDGQRPPFLTPTHSQNRENNLPKWRTLKECLRGLRNHHHINFPEKRLKIYRQLEPGQNWRNLPLEIQKEAMGNSFYSGGGKTGFFRRLSWDKPSPTLVTHPAMPATDLAHPEENRPLSVEEYKRIQEFPDNWEFAGSLIQQYKQIGNAVPISLGYAVGILIKKLLDERKIENPPSFKYSRYQNTSDQEWLEEFRRRTENSHTSINYSNLQLFDELN